MGRRLLLGAIREVRAWALVLVMLAVWQFQASRGVLDRGTLPPPSRIGQALFDLTRSGELLGHVTSSATRVVYGFCVASALALSLCVAVARWPNLSTFLRRFVDLLRPIPPLAWVPLSILWFGIGGRGPIFIVSIGAFFPIVAALLEAVRNTEARYVETALTLGADRRDLAYLVILPLAVPKILTGLRVGLGVAWTSVIAAELVAGQDGLGYLLNANRLLLRSDVVVASMVAIGVVGLVLTVAFTAFERLALRRWANGDQ